MRAILTAKRGARVGLVFLNWSCIGLACPRVSLASGLERTHLCDSQHRLCRRVLGPNSFTRQYCPAFSGPSLGIQSCSTAMRHSGRRSQKTRGGTLSLDENIRQAYKRNTCTLWCRTDNSSSRGIRMFPFSSTGDAFYWWHWMLTRRADLPRRVRPVMECCPSQRTGLFSMSASLPLPGLHGLMGSRILLAR